MIYLIQIILLLWASVALADDLGCFVSGGTVPGAFTQFTGTATSVTAGVTDKDDSIASPYATPTMTDRGSNVWTAADITAGSTAGLHKIRMTGTVNGVTETGIDTFVVASVCPLTPTVAGRTLTVNADGSTVSNVSRIGTAQAGSTSSITLDTGATTTENAFQNNCVTITSGTGAFQSRNIGYYSTARVAVVTVPFFTAPTSSSVFQITAGSCPMDFTMAVIVAASPAPTATSIASTSFSSASAESYIGGFVECILGEKRKIDRYDVATSKISIVEGRPFTAVPAAASICFYHAAAPVGGFK